MNTLRERFESNETIAKRIKDLSAKFKKGMYVNIFNEYDAFLNGAWFMFQELNKDEN